MKTWVCNVAAMIGLALCSLTAFSQDGFEKYFEAKRLRVDFALSGDAQEQRAALQQLREEPVWGGPRKNLVDPFGYGGYYVKVYDRATKQLIYSRGFNTLFEEWRTTEQAKNQQQSWTNSFSMPYPKQPVEIELSARDKADNRFYPLLKIEVDPQSISIDRGALKNHPVRRLQDEGDMAEKVDFVFLPEGYTETEMGKFEADARRFMELLFTIPPYDARRSDFNVWAVDVPSEESGTDLSGKGIYRNTAFGSGFYTFGLDRYLTTSDMKSIRDALWNVPCDAIFILVNSSDYGGGGIYNYYAMGTADHERTAKVFVHELGHSFAGLADEYFESEVAYGNFYNVKLEPWEPNITTLVNFDSKWKDLLSEETPVPTPAAGNEAKPGVYEGGGYVAKGVYRPMVHCMMRDYHPFCPVCRRAILKMIDYLSDK